MNQWTLATRDGFFAIHDQTMEDEVITGRPLLIDPSITFRKHFEIPSRIDKNPDKLKLELFARFLPSEIDEYVCQFQDGPVSDEGARRVLGLAIKEKDMQWLEGLHGEEGEKYFLENLLRPARESGTTQALELPLPNGVYFGVFEGNFLGWARYLSSPKTKSLDQTRDYVHDEFQPAEDIQTLPDFPENLENSEEWIQSIAGWLPETPDPGNVLSRERTEEYWEAWRSTAWTLLMLLFVTLGTWIYYNSYVISVQNQWLKQKSKKVLDKPTTAPNKKLKTKIQSIQKKLKTRSEEILDIYPRLYQLDQAIRRNDVTLLQLQLRNNQGQLALATDSLQSAESMKTTLLEIPRINRVEIVSTNPQQNQEYNYKVNINMKWNPKQ